MTIQQLLDRVVVLVCCQQQIHLGEKKKQGDSSDGYGSTGGHWGAACPHQRAAKQEPGADAAAL